MIELELGEILYGVSSLLFVGTSLLIAYKFLKRNNITFKLFGVTWALMSSAWWGSSFGIISILLFGDIFPEVIHIAINNLFIPFAIISWMNAFLRLVRWDKFKLKIATIIITIIVVIYESVLIFILTSDHTLLGKRRENTILAIRNNIFVSIFHISILLLFMVTGYYFSYRTYKNGKKKGNRQRKIQGKLLTITFTIFFISSFSEALFLIRLNTIAILTTRSLLLFTGIMFYISFFIPSFIRKLLRI